VIETNGVPAASTSVTPRSIHRPTLNARARSGWSAKV